MGQAYDLSVSDRLETSPRTNPCTKDRGLEWRPEQAGQRQQGVVEVQTKNSHRSREETLQKLEAIILITL